MKRLLMGLLCLAAAGSATLAKDVPIDRQAVATRHNIHWNDVAGRIPLGNGEFCFGADGTGLQTFSGNSMSHWGWHSFPLPPGVKPGDIPPTGTMMKGRVTGADTIGTTDTIRQWQWDNPHLMNLGRLRLMLSGTRCPSPQEITDLDRTLDLWCGLQTARFKLGGKDVRVETCVHPELDQVAVRIESALVETGELGVLLDFAYPSLQENCQVGDFARTAGHTTPVTRRDASGLDLKRTVDATVYQIGLGVTKGSTVREPAGGGTGKLEIQQAEYGADGKWKDVTGRVAAAVKENGIRLLVDNNTMGGDPALQVSKRLKVTFTLDGRERQIEVPENQTLRVPEESPQNGFLVSAGGSNVLEMTCAFSSGTLPAKLPSFAETRQACAARWERFWNSGGAIDLSASKDPRWKELERRIVLSQYNMAAQSAGSWPSAETGLLGLDMWRGQFHMEMVWWHLAHYALWGRWEMGEEALGCYRRFLPVARQQAAQLGYKGLKWGKSCGPEGRSAPWVGNQALLWKQPHPIFFAELEYRLKPTRATLEKWSDIIEGTAENMADYPTKDEKTGIYALDPVVPPCEQGFTRNDVFDLAYWRWGLDKAQEWRERMGLQRVPRWDEVRKNLTPLPVVDGLFVHSTEWRDTYTKRAWEHPDPIGVFGMLPPTEGVDRETAHRTAKKVWEVWDWDRTWGWDLPWMAMSAARNGEPAMAVEALLKDSDRNHFDETGINTGGPCPYLPGNGGLLYAVAMMAAGWDGAPPRHAPGFPADGSWVVRWEGLRPAP